MKTIENIKKVALVFFIITGLAHLFTTALISNQIMLKQAYITNKILDIPFIITGLIYGLSSLRLSLTDPNKDHKILDISFIVLTVVTLAGLLIINLALPNLQ